MLEVSAPAAGRGGSPGPGLSGGRALAVAAAPSAPAAMALPSSAAAVIRRPIDVFVRLVFMTISFRLSRPGRDAFTCYEGGANPIPTFFCAVISGSSGQPEDHG